MRLQRTLASLAVLAATTGALAGCKDAATDSARDPAASSSSSASASTSATASATPEPTASEQPLTQAELVDAITVGQVKAGSAHLDMKMTGASPMTAEGDVAYRGRTPSMRMTMSMAQLGSGRIEMRVVDGLLYLAIPQMTPPGKFLEVDPRDPSDPMSKSFAGLTEQMDPLASVKAMRAGVEKVRYVGRDTVDGEPTGHYEVSVDSKKMFAAMGQPSAAGMPATLTYDMWLDAQRHLRRMTFEVGGVAMDMRMSKWGEPVKVTAPPAAKIVRSPQQQQQ